MYEIVNTIYHYFSFLQKLFCEKYTEKDDNLCKFHKKCEKRKKELTFVK